MRRLHRVILLAALVALAPVLAGCENIDFDKLDFLGLSQKKKLPGVRKPVFPEGVPGVSQGIPKEYQKSYVEQQQQQQQLQNESASTQPATGKDDKAATNAADKKTAAVTPAEKPKPKPKRKRTVKRKPKPKPATTAAAPAQPAQPNPAAAQQQSPWPASGQQQQQTAPWPSAPAPGSYSR
jgi:hypothetical protein